MHFWNKSILAVMCDPIRTLQGPWETVFASVCKEYYPSIPSLVSLWVMIWATLTSLLELSRHSFCIQILINLFSHIFSIHLPRDFIHVKVLNSFFFLTFICLGSWAVLSIYYIQVLYLWKEHQNTGDIKEIWRKWELSLKLRTGREVNTGLRNFPFQLLVRKIQETPKTI